MTVFVVEVNGRVYRRATLPTVMYSLLDFLRDELLLKGTKCGCNEGGCGACTVLVSDSHAVNQTVRHRTANSCITPLLALHGMHVTTIEGLGDTQCPHPIQRRVAELNGTQCGYCTPGMVMSMYGKVVGPSTSQLNGSHTTDMVDMEDALEGNLCRCTGYRPLLDIAKTLATTPIAAASPCLSPVPCSGAAASDYELPASGKRVVESSEATIAAHRKNHHPDAVAILSQCKTGGVPQPSIALLSLTKPDDMQAASFVASDGSQWIQPRTLNEVTVIIGEQLSRARPSLSAASSEVSGPTSASLQHDAAPFTLIAGNGGFLAQRRRQFAAAAAAASSGRDDGDTASLRPLPPPPSRPVYISLYQLEEGEAQQDAALHIGGGVTLDRCLLGLAGGGINRGGVEPSAPLQVVGVDDDDETLRRAVRNAVSAIGTPQARGFTNATAAALGVTDLTSVLLAADATVRLLRFDKRREAVVAPTVTSVPLRDYIARSSKSGSLECFDFVLSVTVPPSAGVNNKRRRVAFRRAALRQINAHSLVSVAACVRDGTVVVYVLSSGHVVHADLCWSEMAPKRGGATVAEAAHALLTPIVAARLKAALASAPTVSRWASEEGEGSRLGYRLTVASSLMLEALIEVLDATEHSGDRLEAATPRQPLAIAESTATPAPLSGGVQTWHASTLGNVHIDVAHRLAPNDARSLRSPVGDALPLMTGLQQATGQAIYVDDIPTPAGCLYASLVRSTRRHATIRRVDTSRALALPGVVAYFDDSDLPHRKKKGEAWAERIFATHLTVTCVDDPIGMIVAEGSQHLADVAAAAVDVEYGEDLDAVVDLDSGIRAQSFMPFDRRIDHGNVDAAIQRATSEPLHFVIASGTTRTGGQEHFYLEPHALLVVPGERDEIEVLSMTQCVAKTQSLVAFTLGIPQSKVNVKVKRIGGAFGGKEVRSTYMSAGLAVAAVKLKRPIRWRIGRAEDMRITGGRHPFRTDWTIVADVHTGKLIAFDATMYNNGGNTSSATPEVMTRALMHICNAYHVPNVRVIGKCVATHIVSNTAYRGFGAPQAMLVIENAMEIVAIQRRTRLHPPTPLSSEWAGTWSASASTNIAAATSINENSSGNSSTGGSFLPGASSSFSSVSLSAQLQTSTEAIRRAYLIDQNDRTHFGQKLTHCRLKDMWDRVWRQSDFEQRWLAIQHYNKTGEDILIEPSSNVVAISPKDASDDDDVGASGRERHQDPMVASQPSSRSRRYRRGIAMVPTLYGINFPLKYLNQAGAHVSVYADGTAVVHHAAVEMGQGVNMKVAQVAARALGIPVEHVHVGDTSIDQVPNTSPTAASVGSDLNCMAVLDACRAIKSKLDALKESSCRKDAAAPTLSFAALCEKAIKARISLSQTGFYATPVCSEYDWLKVTTSNADRGPAFAYFVTGVGCAEVEVDILTGLFRVRRCDLLMDVGDTLNPYIDIGQVEGSFMQGLGWLTMEELVYHDPPHQGDTTTTSQARPRPSQPVGALTNPSPHTYKIPSSRDVPIDFRVELLHGAPNPYAVHGSKAVGEPPFFLPAAAYFAIKEAIRSVEPRGAPIANTDAARPVSSEVAEGPPAAVASMGHLPPPVNPLDAPLTAEKIRMACHDAHVGVAEAALGRQHAWRIAASV